MRFHTLSTISLIGCAAFVVADLSSLQGAVREQLFAHHDLDLALRNVETGGRENAYNTVEGVIWYHRKLVESVRQGSARIRQGPDITALEAPQLSLITDMVIPPLQQNMNTLIRYKGAFETTRRVYDMYRGLQESADAHKEFANALASKVPAVDGIVVQMGSGRFGTHISNAISVYKTNPGGK
jgi:hypothetical protein